MQMLLPKYHWYEVHASPYSHEDRVEFWFIHFCQLCLAISRPSSIHFGIRDERIL
jgi:hypothetical protein